MISKSKLIKKDKKKTAKKISSSSSSSSASESSSDDEPDIQKIVQQSKLNLKFEEVKPKPIEDIYLSTRRLFTTTLVVPSSIVDNAQSLELKTYLVGQIAKAAALFCFNEIVILSCDKQSKMKMMADLTTTEFFVKNLEYLETPQYLRKMLFPKHAALRFASLMNPLDTPHHMRATEWLPYREGVVINRPVKDMKGSWVNIGIYKDCQIDLALQEGTRVTVKLDQRGFDDELKHYSGKVVSQSEPLEKSGNYWGYQVRVAANLQSVFDESPYEGGYDLKLNCTKRGLDIHKLDFSQTHANFKHALVMFQGLETLEGLLELDEATEIRPQDLHKYFDYEVCGAQEIGSLKIRTEEDILVSMSSIQPKLRATGLYKKK